MLCAALPLWLGGRGLEHVGDGVEQGGFGTGGSEGDPDASRCFDDAGGDFEETHAHCGELGGSERGLFRDGLLYAPHQPVGGSVQDQAHLVGIGRPARGAVAGKLALVQLDQIFGIAPRAVIDLVQVFRAGRGQRGDDGSDVHAHRAGLDPGDDAALALPTLCAVAGLGKEAQSRTLLLGALCRADIGHRHDCGIGSQHRVGRHAKHIIDAIGLAKVHHFGSAVVAVTPDRDVGGGPVAADMAEQPPDMSCRLGTRWRLAGAQQHCHRAPRRRVIDMDRHETALTMMAIPKRQLLITVHDITRVIDIQRHARRRGRIAGPVGPKLRFWSSWRTRRERAGCC